MLPQVYVDTLGKAEKYQARLLNLFPNIRFTVCNKADALYPVVGAASVMAKVTRDYELAMWPHRNPEVPLKGPLGSGYPSDPVTCAWLNANVDKIHVFHRTLVRYSWSSAQRVLTKHAAKGFWDPSILPSSGKTEFTVQSSDKENKFNNQVEPRRRFSGRRRAPLRGRFKKNP